MLIQLARVVLRSPRTNPVLFTFTFTGVTNMQSGFYWVFIPSSDSPNWQVGHYDNEFKTVIVCGQLDVYDVGIVVFGERVIRSVQ